MLFVGKTNDRVIVYLNALEPSEVTMPTKWLVFDDGREIFTRHVMTFSLPSSA